MSLFDDNPKNDERKARRLLSILKRELDKFLSAHTLASLSGLSEDKSESNKIRCQAFTAREDLKYASQDLPSEFHDQIIEIMRSSKQTLDKLKLFPMLSVAPASADATNHPIVVPVNPIGNAHGDTIPPDLTNRVRDAPSPAPSHANSFHSGSPSRPSVAPSNVSYHTPSLHSRRSVTPVLEEVNARITELFNKTKVPNTDPGVTHSGAPVSRRIPRSNSCRSDSRVPLVEPDKDVFKRPSAFRPIHVPDNPRVESQGTVNPPTHPAETRSRVSPFKVPSEKPSTSTTKRENARAKYETQKICLERKRELMEIERQMEKKKRELERKKREIEEEVQRKRELLEEEQRKREEAKEKEEERKRRVEEKKKRELEEKEREEERKRRDLVEEVKRRKREVEEEAEQVEYTLELRKLKTQAAHDDAIARYENENEVVPQFELRESEKNTADWVTKSFHRELSPPRISPSDHDVVFEKECPALNPESQTFKKFLPKLLPEPKPERKQQQQIPIEPKKQPVQASGGNKVGVPKPLVSNPSSASVIEINASLLQLQTEQGAREILRNLRPSPENRFSGENADLDFESHFNSFEKAMEGPGVSDKMKFGELQHWFSGTAMIVVNTYKNIPNSSEALAQVYKELKSEFGRKPHSAQQMLDELLDGSSIDSTKYTEVQAYTLKLKQAYMHAKETKRTKTFDLPDTYTRVLKCKFPAWVSRWINHNKKHMRKMEDNPTVEEFTFLDLIAFLKDNNVFNELKGVSERVVARPANKESKNLPKKPHFKVAATHVPSTLSSNTQFSDGATADVQHNTQNDFCEAEVATTMLGQSSQRGPHTVGPPPHPRNSRARSYAQTETTSPKQHYPPSDAGPLHFCTSCVTNQPGYHSIATCRNFLDMNEDSRWDFCNKHGHCYICLKRGHVAAKCESKQMCKDCQGRHHVLLCKPRNYEL